MIERRNKSVPMMASQLIEILQTAITNTGDKPVILNDPDTNWKMDIIFTGLTSTHKNYMIDASGYGSELSYDEE